MQLAPNPPATSPVLAQFNYAIRGPKGMPHMGLIEAVAWPTGAVAVPGGFDDAVAAATAIAAAPAKDGIHNVVIQQAQGVLQATDGSFSIVPLGGAHRDTVGPLFVDGKMFEAATLSLQITRSTAELVAVVGATRVLDLRHTGSAVVLPTNTNPPREAR